MFKPPDGKTSVYEGFSSPKYTQTPDAIFDELLPDLSEAELKVLLYIVRRTFGFKKDADNISLRQLSIGITTKDGRVLDRGTGLSKSGVTKALVSLRTRGILIRSKNSDSQHGSTPTTYRLRMLGEPLDTDDELPESLLTSLAPPVHTQRHPLSTSEDTPVYGGHPGLSTTVDPQETVEQETAIPDRPFEISKHTHPKFDPDRQVISDVIRDFARELGDTAPLPSTVTRAYNIYRHSGQDLDGFIDHLYEARRITQERTASIKTQSPKQLGPKPKVGYFFSVLESLIAS